MMSEMLYMVLRMVIVCCGGLVLSKIALEKLSGPIERAGQLLGINNEAVVGLILSLTQSLAMLQKYASEFALDQKTGIEISEASPNVSDSYAVPSYIGQGTHLYTTNQLARYAATIANKGTRYKAHFVKSVLTSDFSKTVYQSQRETLSQANFIRILSSAIMYGLASI